MAGLILLEVGWREIWSRVLGFGVEDSIWGGFWIYFLTFSAIEILNFIFKIFSNPNLHPDLVRALVEPGAFDGDGHGSN